MSDLEGDMHDALAHMSNAISWMNCNNYENACDRLRMALKLFEKHGIKKEAP